MVAKQTPTGKETVSYLAVSLPSYEMAKLPKLKSGKPKQTKATISERIDAGGDMVIRDMMHPYHGRMCSIRDFAPGSTFEVRYRDDRSVFIYTVK